MNDNDLGSRDNSEDEVNPRGFGVRKNLIIIVLAAVLALGIGGTAIAIGASNSASKSTVSGIQLAERYLSELKYEQAVIEFQRILEIEPRNVEAYLGLARAYLGLGDIEKALEVLYNGLEITGDERLQALIGEIEEENEPVFGSMGSVTILDEKYDIATTDVLDLTGSSITDDVLKQIAPQIEQLVNLEYLYLPGNQISDISPLEGLTSVIYLDLSRNQIEDISSLSNLTNLTELHICQNQISDISPLAGLVNLDHLNLQSNNITDISAVAKLTNLDYLWIGFNKIADFTPISSCHKLRELELQSNNISDLTFIKGLTEMRSLNLSNNQIQDLSPLEGLTDLSVLRIRNSQIKNIEPLAKLTNLTRLELQRNEISDEDKAWLQAQLPNCKILFEY